MSEDMRKDVLQPVDDAARAEALALIEGALWASLATLEPETGHPVCSRVGVATDEAGAPVFLTSSLAAHGAALAADPRCSLMFGEPKGGDPLAHARITVIGKAVRITDDADRAAVRARYLARHPKAKLYVDFADFSFWRLAIERAAFNAGFGKAFAMGADDLAVAR